MKLLPAYLMARLVFSMACFLLIAASSAFGQAQSVVDITIRDNFFEPREQVVQVGQIVRFTNRGSAAHTVTRSDPPQTDIIPTLGGGAPPVLVPITREMFAGRDVLNYYCFLHGNAMSGVLRLQGGQPPIVPPASPVVSINVVGEGRAARLIEENRMEQQPAEVKVGQTVRWLNPTGVQHLLDQPAGTAAVFPPGLRVLPAKGADGKPGTLEIPITAELFARAGGSGINTVNVPYISQPFEGVGSSLRITGAPTPAPAPDTGHPSEGSGGAPVAQSWIPRAIGTPYANIAVFEDEVIDSTVTNSYYILAADMNNDGFPDLVTSGLGAPEALSVLMRINPNATDEQKDPHRGTVAWYQNPGRRQNGWSRRVIAKLDVPVPVAASDIDGDGLTDVAVSWNYGLCIFNCQPGNGITSWFKNPGVAADPWVRYPIGQLLANHRLFFGHYLRPDRLDLLALPVVGGPGGERSGALKQPIKSTVYVKPEDPINAKEWEAVVANDKFTLIHDAAIHKFREKDGSQLDSALIAGGEGIGWIYADENGEWKSVMIGEGEQMQQNPSGFKGSGGVTACRLGSDPFAYLVAHEPLHGNVLAVYSKDIDGSLGIVRWKRHILDTFGAFTASGEGPMHHVVAADFDGDGNDEFLVALRGPLPYQGVFLYKAVDPARGKFTRQRVSSISTARIAIADFDGDGRLDFATAPYDVSTYFDAHEPHIMLFFNRTAVPKTASATATVPDTGHK